MSSEDQDRAALSGGSSPEPTPAPGRADGGGNGEEDETRELVVLDPDQLDLDLSHGRIAKIENLGRRWGCSGGRGMKGTVCSQCDQMGTLYFKYGESTVAFCALVLSAV